MNETIKEIPLDELHPFPDHPFGVRDDEAMAQTVESIREYGVLVPAIARPREEGGYELIAGHRRKHACELAGRETMPVIVRDIDRNAAIIIMVDSNLQRESILPSEKAKAYKNVPNFIPRFLTLFRKAKYSRIMFSKTLSISLDVKVFPIY